MDVSELLHKKIVFCLYTASQRLWLPLVQRVVHFFAEALSCCIAISVTGASLLDRNPQHWFSHCSQCADTSYGCKMGVTASSIKDQPDLVSCKIPYALRLFLIIPNLKSLIKFLRKMCNYGSQHLSFVGKHDLPYPNNSGCLGNVITWINTRLLYTT